MEASTTKEDIWAKFWEARDAKLRNELITEYAPLVRFVVGRLGIPPSSLLEAEDLISYGMIGLINAIDRYDPTRGVRFEAFATPRIRGAVIDQLRTLNWMPRSAVSRVRQIETTLAGLEQKLGRPAKEEEVAVELGVSTERYRQMLLEASATVLSLDAPLGSLAQDDETTSLSDLIEDHATLGPAEQAEQGELAASLAKSIEHLPSREQLLLALYYQEELTMKEISKIMSVSESRVCQLHMQAIMRLRASLHGYRTDSPRETATGREANGTSKRQSAQDTKGTRTSKTAVGGGRSHPKVF